jgi:polysaccharide export outer membrane protein
MPEYVIEPPDILQIEAVRIVPLPPYHIEPLDSLAIYVTDALPQQPIQGVYPVDPDGTINLGFSYGTVPVVDLTIDAAKAAIENHLKQIIKPGYQVNVSLAETRGKQQITGPHLVRQDGKISLGTYGSVPVAGLTLDAAKAAVERHLARHLSKPEVSIDVAGYNSKVFYVITDNAGFGEAVYRLPITGNETVLDALSQTFGLPPTASKKRIWLARPVPADAGCEQILPVDWCAITQRGLTDSNYQILAGDRIYVQSQPILTFTAALGKVIAPVERVFGIILLGASTVQTVQGRGLFGANGGN